MLLPFLTNLVDLLIENFSGSAVCIALLGFRLKNHVKIQIKLDEVEVILWQWVILILFCPIFWIVFVYHFAEQILNQYKFFEIIFKGPKTRKSYA